jgi:tRNA-uridine 2-sulfurtransferase
LLFGKLQQMTHPRVIVGMSGGVDSSVAALLLKQQGYDVRGLFMKNWEDDDDDRYCSARTDLVDAVAVADTIGIDIEVVNFSAEYKERVFAEFLAEYEAGRTPNPDVLCNAEIKFRAFLDHALALGAELIATGHYARVNRGASAVRLLRGKDEAKDQSYFLYRLQQEQLQRVLFPLGELRKVDVRRIARSHGLGVHAKRDSTGICFIGERPFRAFLSRYLASTPGDICTADGTAIGRHAGLVHYTIGQRQGLGIGGLAGRDSAPWYVARKDLARNRLIAVQGHDHPLLLADTLSAIRQSWIAGSPPDRARAYTAKTRYRQSDSACRIVRLDAAGCTIEFDRPQWAVTPGQSVVLYEGDACLGGAIIDAAHEAACSHSIAALTYLAPAE